MHTPSLSFSRAPDHIASCLHILSYTLKTSHILIPAHANTAHPLPKLLWCPPPTSSVRNSESSWSSPSLPSSRASSYQELMKVCLRSPPPLHEPRSRLGLSTIAHTMKNKLLAHRPAWPGPRSTAQHRGPHADSSPYSGHTGLLIAPDLNPTP